MNLYTLSLVWIREKIFCYYFLVLKLTDWNHRFSGLLIIGSRKF